MAPAAIGACCPKKRGAFSRGECGFVTRPPEVDDVDGGLVTRPPEVSPGGLSLPSGEGAIQMEEKNHLATRTTNLTIRRIWNIRQRLVLAVQVEGKNDAIMTRSGAGGRRALGQPTLNDVILPAA